MNQESTIDIHSEGEYPSNALSNFYPHSFNFDGVECASMEGLLQSLKTKNSDLQKKICGYTGKKAKKVFYHKFQNIRWKLTGNLYWKGKKIKRSSDEYQKFLDKAYRALCENKAFIDALIAAKDLEIAHSIGKRDSKKTILTEYEFVSRLLKCREWALTQNGI